ncbi:MAG: prepilin-type N-terminal cleavage/methylation domain-containing protein [Phycisphaerales bacterium]|jgi:prepilin-type N-terminal cleavage/methylation domain-containing protein|nr:prepilin-type N-terminal cleavage/methylation domain-containing protein [Phycisphaerales bacterium]
MTNRKTIKRARRGFSLVEMLIALGISAALLTATLFALQTSFFAYQVTADQASTHAVGRLVVHRMMAMIRAGQDFRPFPADIRDQFISSDYIEFFHPDTGQVITISWDRNSGQLLYSIDGSYGTVLLEGVVARTDADGFVVNPFLLEWEPGRRVYRVTIDLMIIPDDSISTSADNYVQENSDGSGPNTTRPIRLVASAMPRSAMF